MCLSPLDKQHNNLKFSKSLFWTVIVGISVSIACKASFLYSDFNMVPEGKILVLNQSTIEDIR